MLAVDLLAHVAPTLMSGVVNCELGTAVVAPGSVTVTPASMLFIFPGALLVVGYGAASIEQVTVATTTSTTFTATFANAHAATDVVYAPTFSEGYPDKQLWQTSEMLQYLADAQMAMCLATRLLVTHATFSFASGQSMLPVPADALFIERVSVAGTEVVEITREDLDLSEPGWRADTNNQPNYFWQDGAMASTAVGTAQFGLQPVPSVGNSGNLFYSQSGPTSLALTDTLAIPDPACYPLSYGVLARAFLKDGEQRDASRSAYCFPAGTAISTSGGSKPIEDIRVGDIVVSHLGRHKRVTELLPSSGGRIAVKIKAYGFSEIVSTMEHPFLIKRWSWGTRKRISNCGSAKKEWSAAVNVKCGDVVMAPLPNITDDGAAGYELGWLLGIYTAEGSIARSTGVEHPKGICLSLHVDETDLAERAISAVKRIDPSAKFSIAQPNRMYDGRRVNSLVVRINSRRAAEWIEAHISGRAKTKELSETAYGHGKQFIFGVLRGWSDGDGHDGTRSREIYKYRCIRVATASIRLAYQMQMLASACGVISSVQRLERDSNIAHQIIWHVTFSNGAADALHAGVSNTKCNGQSKLWIEEGYLCSHVKSVELVSHPGPWFNFSVEDDESYIANGYAVHNCTKRAEWGARIVNLFMQNNAMQPNQMPPWVPLQIKPVAAFQGQG